MDKPDFKAIRERLENAIPGPYERNPAPWKFETDKWRHDFKILSAEGSRIIDRHESGMGSSTFVSFGADTAEFIAHAPTDLLKLCDWGERVCECSPNETQVVYLDGVSDRYQLLNPAFCAKCGGKIKEKTND